jgi:hypothetical protein
LTLLLPFLLPSSHSTPCRMLLLSYARWCTIRRTSSVGSVPSVRWSKNTLSHIIASACLSFP